MDSGESIDIDALAIKIACYIEVSTQISCRWQDWSQCPINRKSSQTN